MDDDVIAPFGRAMLDELSGIKNTLMLERDDGFRIILSVAPYLAGSQIEPKTLIALTRAVKFCHDRNLTVLDVGASAGRHSRIFEPTGVSVWAVEPDPVAACLIAMAAPSATIYRKSFGSFLADDLNSGNFGAILFAGDSIGIAADDGSPAKALKRLAAATPHGAPMIIEGTDRSFLTTQPGGQYWVGKQKPYAAFRYVHGQEFGQWVRWWIPSIDELGHVLGSCGWRISELIKFTSGKYVCIAHRDATEVRQT